MRKGINRNLFYGDPRENPVRRIVCDLLISKGEQDYYNLTTLYSNYYLEMIAGAKYGWRRPILAEEGSPVNFDTHQAIHEHPEPEMNQ